MKIIVDEKETEVVGTDEANAIVHANDIVRHAARLREKGAKSVLFELTEAEAESVGDLPRSKDFRVSVGPGKPAKPDTNPAA
jgi:hypothetical protein